MNLAAIISIADPNGRSPNNDPGLKVFAVALICVVNVFATFILSGG